MKKVFRTISSALFATAIAFPVSALATPAEEFDDVVEEQVVPSADTSHYNLVFLEDGWGLHFSTSGMRDDSGSLIMFLSNPHGKIVKDAQVVTTVIDQNGDQLMRRAQPLKGGYLVDTSHVRGGKYRLETEVITGGWLLTDEFYFEKV